MARSTKIETLKTNILTEFHNKPLPNPVIQWQPVYRSTHSSSPRSERDLIANFSWHHNRTNAEGVVQKNLVLRVGKQIMSELGWKHGDYILICYDPDDITSIMALRHEKGYKIAGEVATGKTPEDAKIFRLVIKGDWLPLPQFKGMQLTYKIDREKRLLFRLNKVD